MINLIEESGDFFLVLGFDSDKNSFKRSIPLPVDVIGEMAILFNEDFAISVGNGEQKWEFKDFKLTDAPEHPFGWTDRRRRTQFHYLENKWHMIPSEIALIGELAKKIKFDE